MTGRGLQAARGLARVGPDPVLLARVMAHRALSRTQLRRLRRTYAISIASVPAGATLRPLPVSLPPVRRLPEPLVVAAHRIRTCAEGALAHRCDLLGARGARLGARIDWHADFKSGFRWPAVFYQDVRVTRLDDDSDAKAPWELSRGHQLLALARAACVFEDERFALELERQLEHWIAQNPPGIGINWANTMEVALRAVNWVWAVGTLEASWRPLAPAVRVAVLRSLQVHGRHIAANLEGTPLLRSNHYLSDVLGLLVLGWALEGDPQAPRWRRQAARAFEREIHIQVLDDGVGFEASLSYHGLALEIFLLGRVVSALAGQPLSSAFDRRLTQMLEVSRTVRHPGGRTPQFGDGDSGRVLPADETRRPTHDHLLWLGAAILAGPRPFEGPVDAEVAWTLGVEAWRAAAELQPGAPTGNAAYPKGGIYVLRAGGAHVAVRCGDVGQNGNGGHAHNDLLSYELSYGDPLVVDSGTYAYTADPAARNAFRGTAAHNGVMVDGQEINPIDAGVPFRLAQVAQPLWQEWSADRRVVRFVGAHDGYRRGGDGILHRRSFSLQRATGRLAIADELLGARACAAESFVHLAPGVRVLSSGQDSVVLSVGDRRVELAFWGLTQPLSILDAWISERFGVRERAPLIVARAGGAPPLRFGYEFGAIAT